MVRSDFGVGDGKEAIQASTISSCQKPLAFVFLNRSIGVSPIHRLYELEATPVCVVVLFGLMGSLASMRTILHKAETAMPLRALDGVELWFLMRP